MRTYTSSSLFTLLAASSLLLTACSDSPKPIIEKASAKAAARPTPAQAEPAAEVTTPRSVFTVDKNSRDPFFPKARFDEENKTPIDVAFDVPAILQQNFHGVISSAGKSIAYVNNVMLEEGRHAVIPIRAGGQEKQVKVHCTEVTKDSVVLEVQGYPEPVRLKRSGR